MRENIRIYRGFHETKVGNSTVIINGKKVKGDWCYGCLLRDYYSEIYAIVPYVNLGGNIHDLSEICIFSVIPKTVGQYIGITDNNNRMIYEGDIVQTLEVDKETGGFRCFPVVFRKAAFWLYDKYLIDNEHLDFIGGYRQDALKVIGNIYDNPKLMESEEKNG